MHAARALAAGCKPPVVPVCRAAPCQRTHKTHPWTRDVVPVALTAAVGPVATAAPAPRRSVVAAAAGSSSPMSSVDAAPRAAARGRATGAASVDFTAALSFDELDAALSDRSNTTTASTSNNTTAAAAVATSQQQQRRTTHGGQGASLSSIQEQERELVAVSSDLPRSEARLESLAAWVGAAAAFGGGIWATQGAEAAQQYFAGYLLEQSLSVDNLFVFVLVFKYFKTPPEHQPRVLTWGIVTAAVLRAVMVLLGTELIERFEPVLLGFALLLLWSAWGLLAGKEEGDEEDLSNNKVVMLCRRLLPVSDHYDGGKFFTDVPLMQAATGQQQGPLQQQQKKVVAKGQQQQVQQQVQQQLAQGAGATVRRMATPLLLTLAVVEISDVVFAVDSIPAVFGVTRDPFIVYTSNIFAILSLRSLYAFVSAVMSELRFLDKAVALVLAFIGGKMVAEYFGADVPTGGSLLTVATLLGGGVAASLMFPEAKKDD